MFSRILGVLIIALSLSGVLARTRLNGVNIAGFDFGCDGDVRISPGKSSFSIFVLINLRRDFALVAVSPPHFYPKMDERRISAITCSIPTGPDK